MNAKTDEGHGAVAGQVERSVRPEAKGKIVRYTKPTGRSEVTARLRKAEGWNDKRFAKPAVYDCEDSRAECECREPQDNDQRVCMACGRWIAYRSRA